MFALNIYNIIKKLLYIWIYYILQVIWNTRLNASYKQVLLILFLQGKKVCYFSIKKRDCFLLSALIFVFCFIFNDDVHFFFWGKRQVKNEIILINLFDSLSRQTLAPICSMDVAIYRNIFFFCSFFFRVTRKRWRIICQFFFSPLYYTRMSCLPIPVKRWSRVLLRKKIINILRSKSCI